MAIPPTAQKLKMITTKQDEERTEKIHIEQNEEQTEKIHIEQDEEQTEKIHIEQDEEQTEKIHIEQDEEQTEKIHIEQDEEQTEKIHIEQDEEKIEKTPIEKTTTSSFKQYTETSTITFEEQLQNEINTLKTKTNVSYDSTNQILTVYLNHTGPWTRNFLKNKMFLNTIAVLNIVSKNHQRIKYVTINYKTTLDDQNQKVYESHYSTTNINLENWDNISEDNRENLLRNKATHFWLHPALNQ